MNISDIRKKFHEGGYTVCMDIPSKVSDSHVFDEDLSVKQNRQMVVEHNAKVDQLRQQKNDRQNELSRQLSNDVIRYILDNYDIAETQARIVETFIYQEKHSSMTDYFSYIDSLCQMVEEVLKIN